MKSPKKPRYPGLSKRKGSPTSHEYVDQDYLHKLSTEELQWLSNFQEEWLRGNFKHGGKRIHKGKKKELECYSRNNARNRDLLSLSKVAGKLSNKDTGTGIEKKQESISHEDVMVDLLDAKIKLKKT